MTDPHHPFRRPDPNGSGDQSGNRVNPDDGPLEAPESAEPAVLDPEFHQSVWKPWEDGTTPTPEGDTPAHLTSVEQPPVQRKRRLLIAGAVAVAAVVAFGIVR